MFFQSLLQGLILGLNTKVKLEEALRQNQDEDTTREREARRAAFSKRRYPSNYQND